MSGEEFLQSLDIWHHPAVSDRLSLQVYEVSDLLDMFLKCNIEPSPINTIENKERTEMQRLAADSADRHFNEKHEGDWYAHYYGFIYGYQEARIKK